MKKYELTTVSMTTPCELAVYRIRALIDIPEYGIRAGDLGGFVQDEANLSHEGSCWVADQAQVYQLARITGNALILDYAFVYGQAHVGEDAQVRDRGQVYGEAIVGEKSVIQDFAHIYEKASIFGQAVIGGHSRLYGTADVAGQTRIAGEASINEGGFAFENHEPLTDITFPSEDHLLDPQHPRFDDRYLQSQPSQG